MNTHLWRSIWHLLSRTPYRLLCAYAQRHGCGAYRPYLEDEVPVDDFVHHIAHPLMVCIVAGTGTRGNECVTVPGGKLGYVQLSNNAQVNLVTFYEMYRYQDHTRCGKFVWKQDQFTYDVTLDAQKRAMKFA